MARFGAPPRNVENWRAPLVCGKRELQSGKTLDGEREQSDLVLVGELYALIEPIRVLAGIDARIAGAEFIDHAGAEDVHIADHGAAAVENVVRAGADEAIEIPRVGRGSVAEREAPAEGIGLAHV